MIFIRQWGNRIEGLQLKFNFCTYNDNNFTFRTISTCIFFKLLNQKKKTQLL